MAHGDYHCCALCDSKMEYSYDARTKRDLCISCMRKLHTADVVVYDGSELCNWIKSNPKKAVEILPELGMSECFYGNEVDEAFKDAKAALP